MTGEAPARVISALDSHRAQAATERRAVTAWADAAVPVIAGWLLAVVGLDLVVTRLFLRLAIFIPKSDAVGNLVGIVARVAAVVDTLVPVVAVLLCAVLLASGTNRRLPLAWQLGIVAASGVAAGGFALTALPPTPTGSFVLQSLTAVAAILLAMPACRVAGDPLVRFALIVLGAGTALAALARVVEAVAAAGGPAGAGVPLALVLAGELAFVAGALAAGLAGLLSVGPAGLGPVGLRGLARHRSIAVGSGVLRSAAIAGGLVAILVLGAASSVPATASIILIWSVGLVSGLVPLPLAAFTAGLAVTGLIVLASGRRELAIGLGTVLLAGYGLAASGLVFAGLLGLALASRATWLAATPSASDAGT